MAKSLADTRFLCQKNNIHVALLLFYIKMFDKKNPILDPLLVPFLDDPLLDILSTWAASTNKVVFSLAYYF